MHIGISPFASSQEVVVALSTRAIDGGIDTLWLGDGYLANPDFRGWAGGMETMTELAWLAGRFPEARVGVTAAVLPLRDPAWLAKQANTLHRIAGGGFVMVVAPGFWAHDLESRGIAFDQRGGVFARTLDELLELLRDVSLAPGPDEGGPPPIWLAGSTATMHRAIERDLAYQSSRATPDELAPMAAAFFDAGGTFLAHRVRVEVGDHGVHSEALDWHAVTGSVDQIVDAFERFAELGVQDLSVVPGQDDRSSQRTVEILVTDVLPQLR